MTTMAEVILSTAKTMRATPQKICAALDARATGIEAGNKFARWTFADGSRVLQTSDGYSVEA